MVMNLPFTSFCFRGRGGEWSRSWFKKNFYLNLIFLFNLFPPIVIQKIWHFSCTDRIWGEKKNSSWDFRIEKMSKRVKWMNHDCFHSESEEKIELFCLVAFFNQKEVETFSKRYLWAICILLALCVKGGEKRMKMRIIWDFGYDVSH